MGRKETTTTSLTDLIQSAHVETDAARRREWTRERLTLRRDGERLTWQVLAPTHGEPRWRPYYIRCTYYEVEPMSVRG